MSTTRYFVEQVLRKRQYLSEAMCRRVIADPIGRLVQPDGRIRYWGELVLPDETATRILRVVTLEDGATIHNAFLDRGYAKEDI